MNWLLVYNLKVFGIGNHILVVDNKPQGVNISLHAKVPKVDKVIQKLKVKQQIKASQAKLVKFNSSDFKKLQKYFDKNYVVVKHAKNYMKYKSRTQKAHFVIYKNGHLSTSKDLLDIDLISNIIRILNGHKPLSIANAVK